MPVDDDAAALFENATIMGTTRDLGAEVDTLADVLAEKFDLEQDTAKRIALWHESRVKTRVKEDTALQLQRTIGFLMAPGNLLSAGACTRARGADGFAERLDELAAFGADLRRERGGGAEGGVALGRASGSSGSGRKKICAGVSTLFRGQKNKPLEKSKMRPRRGFLKMKTIKASKIDKIPNIAAVVMDAMEDLKGFPSALQERLMAHRIRQALGFWTMLVVLVLGRWIVRLTARADHAGLAMRGVITADQAEKAGAAGERTSQHEGGTIR